MRASSPRYWIAFVYIDGRHCTRWTYTKRGRNQLRANLRRAGLRILTAGQRRPRSPHAR